ncbi:hypothetical protein BHM03_00015133 [Ensete ventricosum]|nr:hypothetical protein BHM03_00015133 [Ensete ventricosum]
MAAPTPNHYWKLLNDPGFTPPAPNPGPPVVSTEAFLDLTQQGQMLAGMVQTIVAYIHQLAQVLAHQRPNAPRQMLQQGVPQSMPTQEEHPDNEVPRRLPNEAMVENPNASIIQPSIRSRNVVHIPSESDAISSDSTDSMRKQLRQVNQRLDEVLRESVKSKEEVGETSIAGSPFVPEIQDKPVPPSFRLPILEPYNGSTNPSEHIMKFRAQMALYDTSNALICRAFPATLKGLARIWYS